MFNASDLSHSFVTLAHREKGKRVRKKLELTPADLKCKAIECVNRPPFQSVEALRKHLKKGQMHSITPRAMMNKFHYDTLAHLSPNKLEAARSQTGRPKKRKK